MEKEALLDIILNDLKEIHALVGTFKGKSSINPAFIKLTRTKLKNLHEELDLLESMQETITTPTPPKLANQEANESSLTSSISLSSPQDEAAMAQSAETLNKEEAAVSAPIAEKKPMEPKPMESKPTEPKQPEPVQQKESSTKSTSPVAESPKPTPIKESNILGESIKNETPSVNERMATQKDNGNSVMAIGKAVDDVRKAIGLNDRFYYQRELFGNNAGVFNQTLDQLNQMESYDSAVQFLQSNFQWDSESEVAEAFLKSIKRRFI